MVHKNTLKRVTGEIIEVEPTEADWSLDVLESLSDYYFTQPAILRAKRAALNQKLSDAGKTTNEIKHYRMISDE